MAHDVSEAAQQLARAGSARKLAPSLGVDRSTIGRWARGEARPTQTQREKCRDVLGIAVDAWDRAPAAAAAATDDAPDDPDVAAPIASEDRTVPRLRALLGRIDAQRAAEGLSARAKLDLDKLEVVALRELGRLEGATLTEAQILAHPAWQRVEDVILGAIERYPLALAAFIDTLDALARAQGGAPGDHPGGAVDQWRRDFPVEVAAIEAAEQALLAAARRGAA